MFTFTSESVTCAHVDKLADIISDSIVDLYLAADPYSRVAVETLVGHGFVVVAGEISSKADISMNKAIPELVHTVIESVGYTRPELGVDPNCEVIVRINQQSPDIARGVDVGGAGDQGIMYGGACCDTEDFMPSAISVARELTWNLYKCRVGRILPWLRPDGKAQATVEYDDDGKPVGVTEVVLSAQHDPDVDLNTLRDSLVTHVVWPTLDSFGFSRLLVRGIFINPTGQFVVGGSAADTGLTGRKIMVDSYGGYFRQGGGAFSSKDPTKVDRSAAYAARWIAKSLVAAGFARKCEVQVAYAIGVARPVSVWVDTFGTGISPDEELTRRVTQSYDLTPSGIIDALRLRTPFYAKLAAFGHFGRAASGYPWESSLSFPLGGSLWV